MVLTERRENKVKKYKVTFYGFNGNAEVELLSLVEQLDAVTADQVIDQAIEVGYKVHGANFRERLDTYDISLMPV
jgi:hypothetical protein